MTMYSFMLEKLKDRMNSGTTYPCFVFFADPHFCVDKDCVNKKHWDNSGFFHVLDKAALENPLFMLIGGDLIDNGNAINYQQFVKTCTDYTNTTKIPIIPVIGNHHYYHVTNPLTPYHTYIGAANFRLEITAGLATTLTIIGFNNARPERPGKMADIPDKNDTTCTKTYKQSDWHLFEFPPNYLNTDSHFTTNIKNSKGNHIIITMHVPPRLNPLAQALDDKMKTQYHYCAPDSKKMQQLLKFYRDLWMLVHGNSTTDKNDSTSYFTNVVTPETKVEMVLTGHVHTYYSFSRTDGHQIDYVISGGGGNNNQLGALPGFPVTKRHYIKVYYNPNNHRFEHIKIDAGN